MRRIAPYILALTAVACARGHSYDSPAWQTYELTAPGIEVSLPGKRVMTMSRPATSGMQYGTIDHIFFDMDDDRYADFTKLYKGKDLIGIRIDEEGDAAERIHDLLDGKIIEPSLEERFRIAQQFMDDLIRR